MNYVLKIFNYRFYVKEFLLLLFGYLFMEQIFSWLVIPSSAIIQPYEKITSILIYGFMLFKFMTLNKSEKIYIGLFTAIMIRLFFESMFRYGTMFEQFTMFTVLFPVIFTLFVKYILRWMQVDLLEFIANFYLVTYIIIMALYGRGFSFSLDSVEMVDYGPFSGDTRIIHASSIFMMIIPLLWYLHKFLVTHKYKFLAPFIFCAVVILVHQHRSVWSSAIIAMVFYFISTIRTRKTSLRRLGRVSLGAMVALVVVYLFISNMYPGFINFLSDRFSEIFDPSKEGTTGSFRFEQRETYFRLFLDRPIFGWTFDGFELPNPLVDWWPEKTGQHFHEGYIEMLFYHGIVGLLLKYSFLVYLLVKAFSKKLSEQSYILIAFGISGFVFSFSYVLPLIFWGHVGMCLYYLEKDQLNRLMNRS